MHMHGLSLFALFSRTDSMQSPTPTVQAVQMVPVSQLRPDPKNPRKHKKRQVDQIAASIRSFGFNVPVLIDAEQRVLAGHGRLLAAKQLGLAEVPTIALSHLTAEQARAFMLADNRLAEGADWDEALLAEHLQVLSAAPLDFDIAATGFETAHIDWLLNAKDRRARASTFEEAVEGGPAISKLGDLWLLDHHRILCGDARAAADHQLLMDGAKAQVVFTDPPYNVRIDGHAGGKGEIRHREFAMASGEMSAAQFTTFLQTCCDQLVASSDPGSIHFICMDWRHIRELLDATKTVYTEWKNLCVWTKDNAGMGSLYRSQHELVFVFKNGTAPHVNNVELGRFGRNRTNVWHYPGLNSFGRNRDQGNLLALHPTVKPVQLVADALLDCSKRGDIVLDPFLGSGTTVIAAEQTERRCLAMDIDATYVDSAIRRWERLTGHVAMHAHLSLPFTDVTAERSAA